MKFEQQFKNNEWQELQFVVLWIIRAIARADGKVDSIELHAMEQISKLAPKFRNEFARELIISIENQISSTTTKYNITTSAIKDRLISFSKLIDDKFPLFYALDFKKTIIGIALYIANSSGDLTVYNNRMSDSEAEAIAELILYLDISQEDLEMEPSIYKFTVDN
jgi:hypothetical protein